MPRAYLDAGRIGYLPWIVMTGMPQNTEMLHTWAVALGGSQAAVNAAMAGLQYLPRTDYNGADRLVVTVNDLGNHGYDPANPAVWSTGVNVTQTVSITVRPVNDAPTVTVPNTFYQVFEDSNLSIPGIVVGDAKDAAYAPVTLRVTLTAAYGTITVNTNVTGGVGASGVANNGTSSSLHSSVTRRLPSDRAEAASRPFVKSLMPGRLSGAIRASKVIKWRKSPGPISAS